MKMSSLHGFGTRQRRIIVSIVLVFLYAFIFWIARGNGQASFEFAVISIMLAVILISLSAIDLEEYRLPNIWTLPLLGLGIAFAGPFEIYSIAYRAASGLAGFLVLYALAQIYARLRGRTGLGMGDVKFLAAGSAWLGIEQLPAVVLLASGSCLATIGCLALANRTIDLQKRFAFGPFIAVSIWTLWVFFP